MLYKRTDRKRILFVHLNEYIRSINREKIYNARSVHEIQGFRIISKRMQIIWGVLLILFELKVLLLYVRVSEFLKIHLTENGYVYSYLVLAVS